MENTLRIYVDDDRTQLTRLAQLDSAPVPRGRALVAEVDGEWRAALPLEGGEAIADPFHRTAELVGMLRLRVAELKGAEASEGRLAGLRARLRPRSARREAVAPAASGQTALERLA